MFTMRRGRRSRGGTALTQQSEGADGFDWSDRNCKNTVLVLTAAGGASAGAWIGSSIVLSETTAVAIALGSTGNIIGSAAAFNAGLALSLKAATLGALLGAIVGTTLGEFANEHDLCGELAKLTDGPGTTKIPPVDFPGTTRAADIH